MEPKHLTTDKNYLPALEGWRGVVALFVVLFHFFLQFSDTAFAEYGYLGVDFFFILSGFIISRQYEALIAMHEISFSEFCIKRLSRLYPLYIASIGFFLYVNAKVLLPLHMGSAVDFGMGPTYSWRLFLQLTMLGNLGGMAEPWNGPAWSVSVEWIVNLVYFALIWQFRPLPNVFLWCGIIICTIYLINISPHSLHLPFATTPVFNPTIARGIVGFSLGTLIFRYHTRLPALPWIALFLLEIHLAIATIGLLYLHDYPFIVSDDYALQLFLFPALIIVSLYRQSMIGWFFSMPPFRFLGRISYSVYLLQIPVGYAFIYSGHFNYLQKPSTGIMLLLILLATSTVSYLLIETPFRYLGRRLVVRMQGR